jgi:type I restriction enzyme S subunit
VDSELGEIPDGWVLNPISEIIEFNPAMPIKKNVAAPYLDMASLPTVGSWPADPIFRPYSSGMKFQNGDTLLARITPCLENGKTAYIQCLKDHSVGWGSTEFIVMRPKPPVPSAVAYLVARNNKFRAHAIQSMTGTSGRQRSQVHTISEFQVIQPDNANIWPYFGSVSVPIFNSIRSFARKNILLIKLRDTLLPKLISGEIRVPEAEHLIEEAAG